MQSSRLFQLSMWRASMRRHTQQNQNFCWSKNASSSKVGGMIIRNISGSTSNNIQNKGLGLRSQRLTIQTPSIGSMMISMRHLGSKSTSSNSSSKNEKKKAMKRQMEQSPVTDTSSLKDKAVTSGFQLRDDREEALFKETSSQFSSSSSTNPSFQVQGFDGGAIPQFESVWETDKQQRLSSLSSLPDDAASLMDKEELFDPSIHLPYAPKDWDGYESSTPLTEYIMSRIGVAGRAITTAEYMRHALTHPNFGYYTNPPSLQEKTTMMGDDIFDTDEWDSDVTSMNSSKNDSTLIGPRGDFVTAPEISHVFGHCLCIWFVTQWQSTLMNKPDQIQLVELGPGRGTLMTDILQLATTSKLQEFGKAIQTVNLIEASPTLRKQQEMTLRENLGHIIDFKFVQVSPFIPPIPDKKNALTKEEESKKKKVDDVDGSKEEKKKKFQMRIEWHDTFSTFQKARNKDLPLFVLAQEFLDALPVHSFQKTEEGWRERLIDCASVEDGKPTEDEKERRPRLRQVLAPEPTPAVQLFVEPNAQYRDAPTESVIEICPEGIILVQDVAKTLEESGGVSLMIDYGQDGTGDTLRAFSNHKQVPLTSMPGQVDVTADVDFFALRNAVQPDTKLPKEQQVHAFGPVTQGEFLMRMGAADMVINSIEQDDTTPEQAQKLTEALKYLILPENMGEKFKVLALAQKRDGIFAPAGMEV